MLSCVVRSGSPAGVRYHVLAAAVFATALGGTAVPASAQIYSWRDGKGTLVLSNRQPPKNVEMQTYAVPEADGVRTTRFVAAARSRTYDDLISEHSQRNGIRPDLVRAVMQVESAFNPLARSAKGALGLMQLMPSTLRVYGVQNPFDPADNVRAGVAYLRELLDRYQNDEVLALAAYNAGPKAVDKHGQNVPPYRETRHYVSQISQMAARPIEARGTTFYKYTEIIDGREVPFYTDKKPATGTYSVIRSR
jgi:soluble lytic murein transglycosylase-like protein